MGNVTLRGKSVDWIKAVLSMNDELASTLDHLRPCTEQEYLDAYAAAHEKAFGHQFEVEG